MLKSKPSTPRMAASRPQGTPVDSTANGVALARSWGRTDLGRHRKVNEDSFFRDDELMLYVVADGMGGHAAGEVASAEACDTVYGMVKKGLRAVGELSSPLTDTQARAICRVLEGAIQAATYMVFAIAELDREKSGMGTTISACLIAQDSFVIAQVGDSRIYRLREGEAVQLTEDHTLVAWEIKQGILTEEQAKTAPYRHMITRAVGNHDYVEVDTAVFPIRVGDRYLLCSDGLHGYIQTEELPSLLKGDGTDVVEVLIDTANSRGGRDNITAIVVDIVAGHA